MTQPLLLGVNLDHIATLREVRGTCYPDPFEAAKEALAVGVDGITLHMREDLRHIQAYDVEAIRAISPRLNLELAVTPDMLKFAKKIQPDFACLVPERREELTTEGGLDVLSHRRAVTDAVHYLQDAGSEVSLFIDPDHAQIQAAYEVGATIVEIHTGAYADATSSSDREKELQRIRQAVDYAANLNLIVNAGHGLNYENVGPIAAINALHELNIGHAIVARALFCGLAQAIREMQQLMQKARNHD